MQKKIILDRSYAFYLLNYIAKMEKPSSGMQVEDEDQRDIIADAITVVNQALILFDKILIEDYYGSSLRHITEGKDWFWEIFEVYSPDDIAMRDPELSLVVEDSVTLDLEDTQIRELVKGHFPRRYLEPKGFSSLIWNVNRTLQTARLLDAAILPWPEKTHLYRHKFAHALTFSSEEKPYTVLKSVMDFQVPGYSIDNLESLSRIRKDRRITHFRELIWQLTIDSDVHDREDVLQRLEDAKGELTRILKPSLTSSILRGLISSPIPFPFNLALEGLYSLIDLQQIKPYSWYFFLLELRKESGSRKSERCLQKL